MTEVNGTKGAPVLRGRWQMTEGSGPTVADSSGAGLTLTATAEPQWIAGPEGAGALAFGDPAFSLATDHGPLVTDQSLTVAAWVRLDSEFTGVDPTLPENWFAWTAVAQSGVYHSPFYLGVRFIEYGGEGTGDYHLHWNFTVAPVDGSDDGPVDWVHAYSEHELSAADVDRWTLLVGVYDLETGVARIYVPTSDDRGEETLPADWPKWHGDENLQLGHAWFRDEFVDQWPGSIGPVWAYAGVLDEADAVSLRDRGVIAGE